MRHRDRHPSEGRGREPSPDASGGSGHDRDDHHRRTRTEGGGRGRRDGSGRAQRGDVRAAILLVLAEGPTHGYRLMQTMTERTGGAWHPSPGAVYPALAQLAAEGLVDIQDDAGRRLARLTETGRRLVEDPSSPLADPFAGFTTDFRAGAGDLDLRSAAEQLQVAVRAVAATGAPEQAAAAAVLVEARRSLYLILAGPS